MAKRFIQKAIQNPGFLHRATGTPEGKPIPANKMQKAMAGGYGPHAKKAAQLARTLGRMNHGG